MTGLLPLLLSALSLGAPPADEAVHIEARLADTPLEPGASSSFVVEIAFDPGAAASEAGMPAPMLQLDVPEGVRLDGPYLTTYEQLSRNEFLSAPYERMVEDGRAEIGFQVDDELAADASLGLIVTAYVTTSETAFYLRRRLELPLVPGAAAVPGDDRDSSWGDDQQLLRIGDRAPAFVLPGADQGAVDLAEHLGQRNILLTTYRAFW